MVHRVRTRGRRPRGSTLVHADARVGRHVAGGSASEVGPRNSIGVVTQ